MDGMSESGDNESRDNELRDNDDGLIAVLTLAYIVLGLCVGYLAVATVLELGAYGGDPGAVAAAALTDCWRMAVFIVLLHIAARIKAVGCPAPTDRRTAAPGERTS